MGRYTEGGTIAAEATPRGRGGISVVRISGPQSLSIAQQLFDKPLPQPGSFKFGTLKTVEGDLIDEGVASLFAAHHSYTGEDVVELSIHGSPAVVSLLLDEIYRLGARPAEPGEFTLRAFLNGRLDLTQAEGVGDLIAASSTQAARQAARQMTGKLTQAVERTAQIVEQLLALTELELDFVEEDVELTSADERLAQIDQAVIYCQEMLKGYRAARSIREGVKVALLGAPNVGKSSLFNALIGEERAIVHKTPGTTRDLISAKRVIEGVEFEFFDAAGIRKGEGEIEDEGVRRAVKSAEEADIILEVDSVDVPAESQGSKRSILIRNKADLPHSTAPGRLFVSALNGDGMMELKAALIKMAIGDEGAGEATVTRERHYQLISRAMEDLKRGRELVLNCTPTEFIAEEWRDALGLLDELTGKRRLPEILNTIFGEFCIGK